MSFRSEVRVWLEENCPASCRGPGEVPGGGTKVDMTDDQRLWLERASDKGYTVPTWPTEYGGADLSAPEYLELLEEMRAIGARAPVMGMGIMMIGPTLLEYGTDDQKARHLPKIARGEVWWCQGYSEPGAGSDLASLRTRAEDAGDHFVINGQKIWTSGANNADWIFCLVRTDPEVHRLAQVGDEFVQGAGLRDNRNFETRSDVPFRTAGDDRVDCVTRRGVGRRTVS